MGHVAGIHVHRIPLHRRHLHFFIVRHRRGQQRQVHHRLYPDHVLIPGMPCRRHRSCVGSDQVLATICPIRVHNGQAEINRQHHINRCHRNCMNLLVMHQLPPLSVPIDRHRCSIRTPMVPRPRVRFNCHRHHRPLSAVRPVRISPIAADRPRCRISTSSLLWASNIRSRHRRHNIYAKQAHHHCPHNRDNTDRITLISLVCH